MYYTLIPLEKYCDLYAFQYKPKEWDLMKQSSGWILYDAQNEYGRMGLPNDYWKHTKLNLNYEVKRNNYA